MTDVRIGIIGLGNIGRFHAAYLHEGKVSRCRLTAVCSSRPLELEGVRRFETVEELLEADVVDAALIATPSFTHADIAEKLIRHGLHVLVEKPPALHKAEFDRILAARRSPSQVLGCMLNQRANPLYAKTRSLLRSGELGEIQRFLWCATHWYRPDAYYSLSDWRATWRGEGGGVLMNQAFHELDLLVWLFGMPQSVQAFCRLGAYHAIQTEDEVTAFLEYPSGGTGVFIASTGEAPGVNRLEIAGEMGLLSIENGSLCFERNEQSARIFSERTNQAFGRPNTERIALPVKESPNSHAIIVQNFVDAILDGTSLIAPLEEGGQAVELANAMLYAHFRERRVELPLDGRAYAEHLQRLIATTPKPKRRLRRDVIVDMRKSFA